MILQLVVSLAIAYLTWSLVAMEINHRRAACMGIPLVRLVVDPMNLVWLLMEQPFWQIMDRLPVDWGTFGRYSRRGWHFHDKSKSHQHYGPVWAIVTPRDIYVYVADPGAVHDIFMRRGDFLRPSKMYKPLEVYGPCISTASPAEWPRHRKVLAAPFNENIMTFVWRESLKQAEGMLQSWTQGAGAGAQSFAKDTRTLSLNVLAATGFRRSYEFRSSSEIDSGEVITYRDALQTVLDNAILLMLVPFRVLQLPIVPKSWSRIGAAGESFKKHMLDMLRQETSLKEKGEMGTGSLMTSFVRALDTYQEGASTSSSHGDRTPAKGLTAEEIFGNIFVINFAGHDTTANTFAFSIILLAAHPEIQSWVSEEIQDIVQNEKYEEWDYNLLFPKLLRSRAVMLETLRLYPPILALPKWTSPQTQHLRVGEKTISIPQNTGVMPSLLAIQTHPSNWEDPLVWKPSRWISSTSSAASDNPQSGPTGQVGQETLVTPAQSTFFPWSDGPQNCPGAKFAQVEFVAVLACLLQNHRVGVAREPGEDAEKAKKRALAATEDCDLQLLLRMRDADSVRLEWERV